MNTTITTTAISSNRPRAAHPPEQRVRRVSLADRIALRLGLALITWSRRPLTAPTREERARVARNRLAVLERERAHERRLHLLLSRR